ncbi:MAG: hypothetical protein ACTS5Y_00335 [Pollutimonas bauzanensis]
MPRSRICAPPTRLKPEFADAVKAAADTISIQLGGAGRFGAAL